MMISTIQAIYARFLLHKKLSSVYRSNQPVMCNLGCGTHFHDDWLNFDFHRHGPSVIPWNLSNKLPLEDRSCDLIYSSHVLEHFSRSEALSFLRECNRVLKPSGVIRVVVPDLENVAREYLKCLEQVHSGDSDAIARYEWIVIELLDQMVRHRSGGEMMRYWQRNPDLAKQYPAERVGSESISVRIPLKTYLPDLATLNLLAVGCFRLSGEVHQWMYDSYSLTHLLKQTGFKNIRQCQAHESAVPEFAKYQLDILEGGIIYRPNSLYIEACK